MSQEIEWLLKEKYGGEKGSAFFADCARLEAGEPLAYVIGFIPFLNCRIYLDSKPLIPRPETEFWVEKVIDTVRGAAFLSSPKILDLCAGSGCIGVAIARSLPEVEITFGELEPRHTSTIEKNCIQNDISLDRVHIYTSNLYKNISGTFDVIVTNPPYIDATLDRTDTSVVDHEPHEALFGGESGMSLITTIIEEAPKHLQPRGQLWIEHEPEQAHSIDTLATVHGFKATPHTDQYGIVRFSVLVLQ